MESLSIPASSLNIARLVNVAGVNLIWTDNISRHLLLSKKGNIYQLELFTCAQCLQDSIKTQSLENAGVAPELVEETLLSYGLLFFPEKHHSRFKNYLGGKRWCSCTGCSSRRLLGQELKSGNLKRLHPVEVNSSLWKYGTRSQQFECFDGT